MLIPFVALVPDILLKFLNHLYFSTPSDSIFYHEEVYEKALEAKADPNIIAIQPEKGNVQNSVINQTQVGNINLDKSEKETVDVGHNTTRNCFMSNDKSNLNVSKFELNK